MNLILFDDPTLRTDLLPLTYTRPVAGMRVGILTLAEKWERHLGQRPSYLTPEYLAAKFPAHTTGDNLFINGALCPDPLLVDAVQQLKLGEALAQAGRILAVRTDEPDLPEVIPGRVHHYPHVISLIDRPWKIFQLNGAQIRADFELLTRNRESSPIRDPHTRVYQEKNIFLEEGVVLHAAILNADNGPIYLGKNAQVQEGAIIRGPFALGEESVINMGGKMRADTSIGPFSKVGGEISNCVVFGYSNKAHDGFLGNSVLGEWCNLGADTNTSNLKNNYDNVKVWSYSTKTLQNIGSPSCGVIMGDHSKSGINTMFNTGTVVGVSSNIFGAGLMPKFIPSFRWGGTEGFATYRFEEAIATAQRVLSRRNLALTSVDIDILKTIFHAA